MNLLRDVHHAQVFRLLVADLDGRLTVERLADHLSALADATLALTLECAWKTVREAASRRAGVCGDCLRQAGRQGTRLRLRPRPDLPLRRRSSGRGRDLLDARAAARDLADDADLVRHSVRHRPATAPQRQCRPDGLVVRCVLALPAQRGRSRRVGVGNAGADARPLLAAATRALGARFEDERARILARVARSGEAARAKCWRCAKRCSTATRTRARCSTSSTTVAAWSTSSSSCSTWCLRMRTNARS